MGSSRSSPYPHPCVAGPMRVGTSSPYSSPISRVQMFDECSTRAPCSLLNQMFCNNPPAARCNYFHSDEGIVSKRAQNIYFHLWWQKEAIVNVLGDHKWRVLFWLQRWRGQWNVTTINHLDSGNVCKWAICCTRNVNLWPCKHMTTHTNTQINTHTHTLTHTHTHRYT